MARTVLERVLLEKFPGAHLMIEPAAGGFIVGLVHDRFLASPGSHELVLEVLRRLGEENGRIPSSDDRIVVFTLRFYGTPRSVYALQAALRARVNTWEEGMRVTHATSLDAYVLAHEIEAEALLIDPQARSSCHVIPDSALTPTIVAVGRYVQFDLQGRSLQVYRVDEAGEGVWTVHIGPDLE